MSDVIIVESPTKARTLSGFLKRRYQIVASYGHIRDLPKSDLGVDVEGDFEPRYVIPKVKQKKATEIIKSVIGAKRLILASDPDREGEAIAWHLAQLIKEKGVKQSKKKNKNVVLPSSFDRVVFHEITPQAVKEALANPRPIDMNLVDAQQARRVLDRLVGYNLSPLLWRKIQRGLSAGRVQSAALRLIVEREQQVTSFQAQEYWIITAKLEKIDSADQVKSFAAQLIEHQGKKLHIKNEDQATTLLNLLKTASYQVAKVASKETKRYPFPPFTTSTLQQAAATRLGFSSNRTMHLAQSLYEQGLITYMRTDSVNLADSAIGQARDYIREHFGEGMLPPTHKRYRTKSRVAQEAHEAIRPTNVYHLSDQVSGQHGRDMGRLYDLVWKRMVACQMREALIDQSIIDVLAKSAGESENYLFRATGSQVKFDGFTRVYGAKQATSGQQSQDDQTEPDRVILPKVTVGEPLTLAGLANTQHFTQPPPRFNDGMLVKALEEKSIGRPSTYAPTIATLLDRGYVEKQDKSLHPTTLGQTVCDFLSQHFPQIVDYSFTAEMEEELDQVARGERPWRPMIAAFYQPFSKRLSEVVEQVEKITVETETLNENCPQCDKPLIVRRGKFGKFVACSGFPECDFTKSFFTKTDRPCPLCGSEVVMRRTRKGKSFYGCSKYPQCAFASWTKPQ